MSNCAFRIFFLTLLFSIVLSACTAATPTDTNSELAEAAETPLPATSTATPSPTSTPELAATASPSATPKSTTTPTATPTATSSATPILYTATATATATPAPPTVTPILYTATPQPTATSSLPGNPIPLTGGSHNGCPLLAPGQYTTDPYGCDSCVTMDLANWAMASVVAPGASLQQVSGAYEQGGVIYLAFASGESINLSNITYRYIVVIVSLSRAIETWEDSLDTQAVSPEAFLSVLAPGTTIGYINNPSYNTTAVKVAPICGQ